MHLSLLSKIWDYSATIYLVLIPCLWWEGIYQDQAQTIGWYYATAWLLGLSLSLPIVRVWSNPNLLYLFFGIILTSLITGSSDQFSVLALNSLVALVAGYCLVTRARSSDWLLRRIKWLVLANVVYVGFQLVGKDFLFQTTNITGFFSRKNGLGSLLLIGMAICPVWLKVACLAVCVVIQSWTALAGAFLLILFHFCKKKLYLLAGCIGALGITGLFYITPEAIAENLGPRLQTWEMMIGQSLQLPYLLWGYGAGQWNIQQLEEFGRYQYSYNVFLQALHQGGILLLTPLILFLKPLVQKGKGRAHLGLIALIIACSAQSLMDYPRFIIIATALIAALEVERCNARRFN